MVDAVVPEPLIWSWSQSWKSFNKMHQIVSRWPHKFQQGFDVLAITDGDKTFQLQSWTKLLRHFTKFILNGGTITNVFNPPPPRQCCYVVKTKSGELQTPRNNIELGRRGIKYSLPACKEKHSWKKCDIRLSQPLLSMIVWSTFREISRICVLFIS